MGERGKINDKDPDYTNYLNECNERSRRYFAKEDEIFSRLTEDTRREVSRELGALRKLFARDLKVLQRKYSHIFNQKGDDE